VSISDSHDDGDSLSSFGRVHTTLLTIVFACLALNSAVAQYGTIVGEVVMKDGGAPLGYTTISVVSRGTQLLTNETAKFTLRDLPPGEVRLRVRRIGFAAKDTAFNVAANDTARIRIEMTRLAIQLPAMVVTGTCTDQTPFEDKAAIFTEIFDQVKQNAERVRLLTNERPFEMHAVRVRGFRTPDNNVIGTTDTIVRQPLSPDAYVPRRVLRRGEGPNAALWLVRLPELPDLADTAFTNNHCFWYAGQTRFESDSVIRVDFEPVPWLAQHVDLEGSIYLRTDGYQLVGLVTKLNRIPAQFPALREYSVRARFSEIVSGVPVLVEWGLSNTYRNSRTPARIETGRVIGVKWLAPTPPRRDRLR
jgi:hypothetical protein